MAKYIEAPQSPQFRQKRFYLHVGARFVPGGKDGITIGNHIYTRSRCPSAYLVAHEYAHVLQWDRIGLRFPIVYAFKRRALEADAHKFGQLYAHHFAGIARQACEGATL